MSLQNATAAQGLQTLAAANQNNSAAILNDHASVVNQLTFPASSSVKGRTLADLLAGMKLTHYDVWERHGSSRASHHVLMLRRAGFSVITEEIDAPTSDGRTARIALYSLSVETIEAAGERGQQFIAEVLAAKRGG